MDEIQEKKSKPTLQIILKVAIFVFALLFVIKIKNFHQAFYWIFTVLVIALSFFGRRANTFWTQKWRFETVEDFLWAIAAILGLAYLIIRAFF